MRTIKTQVFNIKELDPSVQQKVRSKHIENMCNWHDGVLDDAGQIAVYLGFDPFKIYYSGFHSQGDGACFVGGWRRNSLNMELLKSYAPTDQELHNIAEKLAKAPADLRIAITHSGHYYHENSMSYDYDFRDLDEETEVDEDAIEAAFQRFAMWIYRQLNKEYESITTDEAIDEELQDVEFFADGRTYYGEDEDEDGN